MASALEGERGRLCASMTEFPPPMDFVLRLSQNLSLGLFRSDYMVHQSISDDAPTIKQVEFNTIASSFGGLSSQTSRLHKLVIHRAPFPA
jgi:Eukaryotic glutathione synthase, ATP binding domain